MSDVDEDTATNKSMADRLDCIVCGELCVDLPIRPVNHSSSLSGVTLISVDPIRPGGGGIVANTGLAMARLGLNVAAMACVGDDVFGQFLTQLLQDQGLDITCLQSHPTLPTSTTAVLIGQEGEHTFAFHHGASRGLMREAIVDRLDFFQQADFALLGYYGLMPDLEHDLAEILQQIRRTGCRTALDSAGGGGSMRPLDRILPHLDIYVPSLEEAIAQTGCSNPTAIIDCYRRHGCQGLVGVKLGERGALLSPAGSLLLEIEPVPPPAAVVDTTGAGDCFYAGLIAGLSRGMTVQEAGQLAAAAGACAVTGLGAITGLRNFDATRHLAGLPDEE